MLQGKHVDGKFWVLTGSLVDVVVDILVSVREVVHKPLDLLKWSAGWVRSGLVALGGCGDPSVLMKTSPATNE